MRTIVTAALQRQYLQTELILWIRLVIKNWLQLERNIQEEFYPLGYCAGEN
jgi:hypothetical protein